MAQYFVVAYLVILFNKTPKTSMDMISARSKAIIVPKTLIEWLYDLRNFLDQKCIDIGRIEGDLIDMKLVEAVRLFNHKYLIRRGNEVDLNCLNE
jgi:hypothetical protein